MCKSVSKSLDCLNTIFMKKLYAEFFGTFWLVFGGCGSAIFAAKFPESGIGFIGVSFAFGMTVLTMAYALGHSGLAIVLTSLTTAAGLLSFSFAELTAIVDIGLFGALGVMLAELCTGEAAFRGLGRGGIAAAKRALEDDDAMDADQSPDRAWVLLDTS